MSCLSGISVRHRLKHWGQCQWHVYLDYGNDLWDANSPLAFASLEFPDGGGLPVHRDKLTCRWCLQNLWGGWSYDLSWCCWKSWVEAVSGHKSVLVCAAYVSLSGLTGSFEIKKHTLKNSAYTSVILEQRTPHSSLLDIKVITRVSDDLMRKIDFLPTTQNRQLLIWVESLSNVE